MCRSMSAVHPLVDLKHSTAELKIIRKAEFPKSLLKLISLSKIQLKNTTSMTAESSLLPEEILLKTTTFATDCVKTF